MKQGEGGVLVTDVFAALHEVLHTEYQVPEDDEDDKANQRRSDQLGRYLEVVLMVLVVLEGW